MEDSGDEGAAEADHGNNQGESGGGGGALPAGGSELSEYERERLENIARNKARLQELGLDDPIVPPRPRPAPKQPRPPRAPDGPRRESSRLQGGPRPRYADAEKSDEEDDEEEEEDETTPHAQTDEQPPQQVQGQLSGEQEPQPPRRSTRVVDSSERGSFSEQTRTAIKVALSTSTLQGTGLELVQFMSATQLPRDRITSAGVRGDAEALDRREGSQLILISLKSRSVTFSATFWPIDLPCYGSGSPTWRG
eukprot:2543109-Prymnesium_polylepis.1